MPPSHRSPDERSAGGLVYRRTHDGPEVALIRVGDVWSLPKGNLDTGETAAQAALREISEETGLPAHALRAVAELPPSEYAYRRRDTGRLVFKRVDHWLVELVEEAALHPQAAEVDEVAWVDLDEAERRIRHRDLRPVLEEARRLLDAGATPDAP